MDQPVPATTPSNQPSTDPQRNGPTDWSERVRSLRLPDRPASPSWGQGWLPWALCVLCGGVALVLAFNPHGPDPAQVEELARLKQELDRFKQGNNGTIELKGERTTGGKVVLQYKGYIVPVQQIKVSPEVGGKVIELNIEEGKAVKKGFILARLERTNYEARRRKAQQAVLAASARLRELRDFRDKEADQLKAELDEAEAQSKQLLATFKRTQALTPGRAVTQTEYEQAESQYLAMEHKVRRLRLVLELFKGPGPREQKIRAAEAELEQAEAELVQADWELGKTIVRAPIDGIILSKKAEEGDLVNPAAFNVSAVLCEMADLLKLEVDVPIPERDIRKVKVGQRCKVRPEAYLDRHYEGRVSRIMPTADRAKGAIPVRVLLDIPAAEAGQYLRPDMGALVAFLAEDGKK